MCVESSPRQAGDSICNRDGVLDVLNCIPEQHRMSHAALSNDENDRSIFAIWNRNLWQYPRELFFDKPIAIAGGRFKSLPVKYGDLAATVLDTARFSQCSRDNVHPRTTHP